MSDLVNKEYLEVQVRSVEQARESTLELYSKYYGDERGPMLFEARSDDLNAKARAS